ncbi:hypothetical protein [Hymenobacter cavernae]|uniref:Outer membrane protein beta-barrel domain-containing protein n=1 Tax=Hymenobacter cavernae TaxID=2044852 RepID=A0ABQ1TVT6_9BACT|nr:hypothetical protein [Hymenobacter cavernae]GGF03241.1 hypothetical protein GCM10011383_12750 [Hymenobacter cavernae]
MKHLLLFVGLLVTWISSSAQAQSDTPTPRRWYVPQHAVLQTAGGIGLVAGGAGYTLGSKRRWDVDALVGYVPGKYTGGRAFSIFTLKGTYAPFCLPVQTRWQVQPLTLGLLTNYTPSAMLNRSRDDKYPYKNYYWWSSTVRLGVFLGGRVGRELPVSQDGRARMVSAYYELGTNDLYAVSLLPNTKGLSLGQILTLGLGVKVDF